MTSDQYEHDAPPARPRTADDRLATRFPDLSGGATSRRWWHRRGRWAVAAVTALALIGAGVAVAETSGADAVSYRTATAEMRDVDSLFTSVATIEPLSQAAVGFPVSGTVASVDVAVGDTVTIGQQLASLDTESLEQTVRSTQATLDQAELVLSTALDGGDVASLTGGGGSSMQPASTSATSATATNAGWSSSDQSTYRTVAATQSDDTASAASTSTDLGSAQQAVLAAQQRVDATMLASQQALTSARAVCAADGTDVTTTTTTDPADADLAACRTALEQVLTAQTAVSEAQQALAEASSALDALLAQAADDTNSGAGSSSGSGALSGSAPSGSNGSSGSSGSTSVQGATSSSPSSEDLIAYQTAVDAAALEVAVARQAVAQATIVSPIEGTVVASTLDVGASVTSGSTTDHVTIQGTGGYEVTTSVGVDDVADLQVGQAATVLPDGGGSTVAGQVVSIALTGDASAATYQVVIGLEGDTSSLRNGATGTSTIVTGTATSALAVPTSAVTVDGDRHTVVVVDGETPTTTTVRVGVIGDAWTQITEGLDEGATVALADLSEPLPGSATEATGSGSTTGTTGGFPGGADFPTGGFPGGGSFRPGN